MGAPTNLSDQGAGEMNAAARMHAEPVMQVNQLTRWYVMTAVALAGGALVMPVLEVLAVLPSSDIFDALMMASFLMFFGGIGIKFLPSSLGGNPHVYSIGLALTTYWLVLGGIVVDLSAVVGIEWSNLIDTSTLLARTIRGTGPALMALGTAIMGYNFWQTMRNRV
jgi:hypothetical protein